MAYQFRQQEYYFVRGEPLTISKPAGGADVASLSSQDIKLHVPSLALQVWTPPSPPPFHSSIHRSSSKLSPRSLHFDNLFILHSYSFYYLHLDTMRRTRASNADKHPGHILLQDKQPRRTSAQVAHDAEVKAMAAKTAEAARQASIKKVAHLQDELQRKDITEQEVRALPPRVMRKEATPSAAVGKTGKKGKTKTTRQEIENCRRGPSLIEASPKDFPVATAGVVRRPQKRQPDEERYVLDLNI